MSPLELIDRIVALKVSGPSSNESAIGVTVNVPVPVLPMVTVPLLAPLPVPNSPTLFTDQYNIVLAKILVVITVNVIGEPSSTKLDAAATEYVADSGGTGVRLVSLIITEIL